jgi:hypothetical protein
MLSTNKVGNIQFRAQSCNLTHPVALDQIMTALMENSNANRPAPATDEVINKLNHQVLEEGCA